MKRYRLVAIPISICAVLIALMAISLKSTSAGAYDTLIKEWRVQWFDKDDPKDQLPSSTGSWHSSNANNRTSIPNGAAGAWIHIVVPPTVDWLRPGLLIDQLYGLDLSVYTDDQPIFTSVRDFDFERNSLLLPLVSTSNHTNIYVRIESKLRAGLNSDIRIGEYDQLSRLFVRKELPDLLLGAAIAFLSLMILICSGYLSRRRRGAWISLGLIMLTISVLVLSYSSLPYIYFAEYGKALTVLFDTSLFILLPSLHFYIHPLFEGRYPFSAKFGQWSAGYYALCFVMMVLYAIIGDPIYPFYVFITLWLLALVIFVHLTLILVLTAMNALRGNRNSLLLSIGFLLFAMSGITDLVLFSVNENVYVLHWWKIGVVALIITLVITLARRISADYKKLTSYSQELGLYNHRLERAEKMKLIGNLAASVAHEVRNPMQVTRGFLQLLSGKADEESKRYLSMAISELDRASEIITDFLTFAKPEMNTIVQLDLQQEIGKIEMIMGPIVAMQGADLRICTQERLYINGNSSKLAQAFINIVQNSIEAVTADGIIEIEAYAEQDRAVIRIKDNGEGMGEEQLAKLGEPFYSTKTKGTGLGLMVTFRIIEVMKGTLEFRSVKGEGTEAIVQFPLAQAD